MLVIVSYATPCRQVEISLMIHHTCTVRQAIEQSGLLQQFSDIDLDNSRVGIYGKKTTLDDRVREGDRVEIYRPLLINPKQARQLRAMQRDKIRKRS